MKKQIKTFIVLCSMCLPLFLATSVHAQFSAGVRAGVNFATEANTGYEHEFLALPYGGVYAQYQVSQIALQLGVNYSGEGNNLKDLSTGDTFHERQSYLTVPLLVQARFAFGGYIELGGQYGILLSSSQSYDGGPSTDDKQYYTSSDFSLGGGIGYDFNHTSKSGLGIEIRYMRGLTSIENNPDFGGDVRSRVLSAGLTYRF